MNPEQSTADMAQENIEVCSYCKSNGTHKEGCPATSSEAMVEYERGLKAHEKVSHLERRDEGGNDILIGRNSSFAFKLGVQHARQMEDESLDAAGNKYSSEE